MILSFPLSGLHKVLFLSHSEPTDRVRKTSHIQVDKKKLDELLNQINQAVPNEETSTLKKGSTSFKYLKIKGLINTANRVFGFNGWSTTVDWVKLEHKAKEGEKWNVIYTAQVRVTLTEYDVHRTNVGSGTGNMGNLGDCIDTAIKASVTDAMKRAFKDIGPRFGLSLY